MQFSDIIGQARIKKELLDLNHAGKMPHAMLITSAKGGGGLALGLALARLLLCEQAGPEGACGTCPACLKSGKWIHPDMHFSFPTIGPKATSNDFLPKWREFITQSAYADVLTWLQKLGAENKQGNITAEECSSISRKLGFQVLEGKYKILVMWMPEYLGKEGNRLLKLIEEPPEKTFFILVAESTELILQTILSRCQLIKMDPLTQAELTDALIHRLNVPSRQAEHIAFLADGNFDEAKSLIETEIRDDSVVFTGWLRACWQGDPTVVLPVVETFAALGRENQKQFFRYGLQFFRELLVALVAGNKPLRLPDDLVTVARNFAKTVDFDKCERLCALLNDDLYYIERNANPRILFTETSIKAHEILRGRVTQRS